MTASALRVVRASPGHVWRALAADQVVGAVTAFLRPDDRWFVHFDADSRADSSTPLLAAVAENAASDRRRVLAGTLLARALRVLYERGQTGVTAEVDDTNTASRSLILKVGARRDGGSLEIIARLAT